MLFEFSFVHEIPNSYMIIFDIALETGTPLIRQQWAILSIIFMDKWKGGFLTNS
jgi:hypothetical protein